MTYLNLAIRLLISPIWFILKIIENIFYYAGEFSDFAYRKISEFNRIFMNKIQEKLPL